MILWLDWLKQSKLFFLFFNISVFLLAHHFVHGTLEDKHAHLQLQLSGLNSTFDTVWCAWVSFKGNSILKHHGTFQVSAREREGGNKNERDTFRALDESRNLTSFHCLCKTKTHTLSLLFADYVSVSLSLTHTRTNSQSAEGRLVFLVLCTCIHFPSPSDSGFPPALSINIWRSLKRSLPVCFLSLQLLSAFFLSFFFLSFSILFSVCART